MACPGCWMLAVKACTVIDFPRSRRPGQLASRLMFLPWLAEARGVGLAQQSLLATRGMPAGDRLQQASSQQAPGQQAGL